MTTGIRLRVGKFRRPCCAHLSPCTSQRMLSSTTSSISTSRDWMGTSFWTLWYLVGPRPSQSSSRASSWRNFQTWQSLESYSWLAYWATRFLFSHQTSRLFLSILRTAYLLEVWEAGKTLASWFLKCECPHRVSDQSTWLLRPLGLALGLSYRLYHKWKARGRSSCLPSTPS